MLVFVPITASKWLVGLVGMGTRICMSIASWCLRNLYFGSVETES